MGHQENFIEPEVIPVDKKHIAKIWKTAAILAVVTIVEYIFAFNMDMGNTLITIFILLTLVKAYFIVSEFMHLKYEAKGLNISLTWPIVFIFWLILALVMEANYIENDINAWW